MQMTIDSRIMRYVPHSKHKTVKACWHDSEGYWITLNEGYCAERTDERCRTIHEDTIAQLRYQIAGITVDAEYWEDLKMSEENTVQSELLSSKEYPEMLVEVIEQDRYCGVLHCINPPENLKEYLIVSGLTITDSVADWRRAFKYDTLEEAREHLERVESGFILEYNKKLLEYCGSCISNANYELYHYDLPKAYDNVLVEYEPEDISTALALYVRSKDWDGRISKENKEWAKNKLSGTAEEKLVERFGSDFIHPAIADGFVNLVRKNDEAQLSIKLNEKSGTDTERLHRLINEWCVDKYDESADFSELERVSIAYTTDPDTELDINVYANLNKLSIVKEYAGTVVNEIYYENEFEMGNVFLNLEFDEVVALTDEQKKEGEETYYFYNPKPTIIDDTEIEGLKFTFYYSEGSGSAKYNGQTIGLVDYATNEFNIGDRGWDVLDTHAPDDDVIDFKEACRKYCEDTYGASRIILPEQDHTRK